MTPVVHEMMPMRTESHLVPTNAEVEREKTTEGVEAVHAESSNQEE